VIAIPERLPRGGERAGASCRTAVPQGGAAAGSKPVTRTKKSADAVDGFFIQAAEGGLVCNLAAGEYGITAPAVYGITAQSAVYVYLGGLMTYSSDELMTYRLRRIPYNGFAVDELYYAVRHNITAAYAAISPLGLFRQSITRKGRQRYIISPLYGPQPKNTDRSLRDGLCFHPLVRVCSRQDGKRLCYHTEM